MLSIYVVSAWVLLQVTALIWKPLGLPEKSVTYLIILLLIGFPFYGFYIWKASVAPLEMEAIVLDAFELKEKASFKKMYFSALAFIAVINIVIVFLIIKVLEVKQCYFLGFFLRR